MQTLLVFLFVLAVGVFGMAIGYGLRWLLEVPPVPAVDSWEGPQPVQVAPGEAITKVIEAAPAPVVVVAPTRTSREQELILESAGGRVLDRVWIDRYDRPVTWTHRTGDGNLSWFVAAHDNPDGSFTYRRVGVGRES